MANDNLARTFYPEPLPKGPQEPDQPRTVNLGGDDLDDDSSLDPASGALKVEIEDGKVTIDLNPQAKSLASDDDDFDANLAEIIDYGEVSRICADLLQAIESDEQSRAEWLNTRAKGIDLLGFRLEEPRGDTGASTAPVEGMSTIRHPLLQEAVIRFQSNASAELLPAEGPVKVRNDAPPKPPGTAVNGTAQQGPMAVPDPNMPPPQSGNELAEALEKDLNHYLTVTDKGYRSDSDRMLFWVGFGGCAFKKVYNCPIKRMPLSRSVDAADLIVNNNANDIDDAGRITHRILMRKSTLVRMQIAGVYRKTATYVQPQQMPTVVDTKIALTQGFNPVPQRPEDHLSTIYEVYAELNIKGFEHTDEDGEMTGLELPYRVTIDKDSREVLEIRRNWKDGDDACLAKRVFVKFPFNPAMGFYDIGLLQILGNATRALTGAVRLMLDSGMFANFPGFMYADVAGRQLTNEFRVPPGGGVRIQTGGKPIDQVVKPLPYKDVGASFVQLVQAIEQTAQRVGGISEIQVGEGRADAPVGTTLALIEQATKMLAAVHIRLHAAQAEEFQLLKERFREDPEAFWRHNKRPAIQWQVDQFLAALDNTDLVPAADPNTPSHMHRIMKAVAIKQLQAMNPQLYDAKAVDTLILNMMGMDDIDHLFAPPQPPMDPSQMQPLADPTKIAALQMKAKQNDQTMQFKAQQAQADAKQSEQQAGLRAHEIQVESQDRAADRDSRVKVAELHAQSEQIKTQAELQKHSAELHMQHQQNQQDVALQHQQNQQENQQNQQDHALAVDQHMNEKQRQLIEQQAGFGGPKPGQGGMSGNSPNPLWPRPI